MLRGPVPGCDTRGFLHVAVEVVVVLAEQYESALGWGEHLWLLS